MERFARRVCVHGFPGPYQPLRILVSVPCPVSRTGCRRSRLNLGLKDREGPSDPSDEFLSSSSGMELGVVDMVEDDPTSEVRSLGVLYVREQL